MKKTALSLLILSLCGCQQSPNKPKTHADYNPKWADAQKPMRGDYWAQRYGYPTSKVDPSWFTQSRAEHNKHTQKTPQGKYQNRSINQLNANGFTALGPKPINAGSNSRFTGRVNVIVSHPNDATTAYLGIDGGGVWKTTTCCGADTTWEVVTDQAPLVGGAIGDLHLDPNDPNIIYAGTGDLRYGSYSFGSAGLMRSKDAGNTWELLGESEFSPYYDQAAGVYPQYQAIGKVRTNPLESNHIVVGTKTGLFFSYDDGQNWEGPCLSNTFTDQRQDVTGLEVDASGNIYAAIGTRGHNTTVQPDLNQNGANGIYKTAFPTSGCPTWQSVTTASNGWPSGTSGGTPFPTNSIGRIDMTMAPSDNSVLYAQVADISNRSVRGVWKTTDGGTQWTQVATSSDIGGCSDSGQQAWYDMGMSVSPTNPNELFLSAVDLFKSSNGGGTFTNSTCGYGGGSLGDFVHVDHHARSYVAGDPTKLLVGSDGGVYFTDNADEANPRDISYTQLNDSINGVEFYSGDISANFATADKQIAVGGAQDNGSSAVVWDQEPVAAKEWFRVNGGDGIYATIEPINEQRVYVESQFGNMRISTSGPLGSYSSFANPWSNDARVPFIFPFHLNKHDCTGNSCDQLMAGTYRIWETTSGGLNNNSWYINSPDLTKGTLVDRSIINQMHYDMADGSVAIVGTNDGNVYYGFNMGAGSANSANWVNVTGGNTVLPNRPVLDVVSHQNIGYAAVGGFDQNTPATPGHVFQVSCDTNCQNATWTDKSGDLPNIPVNSVMVNPNFTEMVFAGTDWGLYYTENISDSSPTWYRFTAGLPSVMIWDLTIDRGMTTLAAFTRSRGAYVWPLPDGIISDIIFKDGFERK